ncbi:unnamed protein product [Rotaria sp. Silwood2]|nr:unnamed protein product [Rotaria sp. Silwood2]
MKNSIEKKESSAELIRHVTDRPGHDRTYTIDAIKINNELGWFPSVKFEESLNQTVDWYLNNQSWLDNVKHGIYQSYYQNMC